MAEDTEMSATSPPADALPQTTEEVIIEATTEADAPASTTVEAAPAVEAATSAVLEATPTTADDKDREKQRAERFGPPSPTADPAKDGELFLVTRFCSTRPSRRFPFKAKEITVTR